MIFCKFSDFMHASTSRGAASSKEVCPDLRYTRTEERFIICTMEIRIQIRRVSVKLEVVNGIEFRENR